MVGGWVIDQLCGVEIFLQRKSEMCVYMCRFLKIYCVDRILKLFTIENECGNHDCIIGIHRFLSYSFELHPRVFETALLLGHVYMELFFLSLS